MASGRTRPTPTGTGNLNSRAPTPTNRIRASHRNTVSLLIPKDEILQQEYDVKDKESSITFLEKSPFCHSGELISNESLILTLLHITQYTGIPRIAIEGMRAIAILLENDLLNKVTAEPTTHQISESISNQISTQIISDLTSSLSTHVIAAISPQIATILTASESLKSNIDDLAKLNNAIEENSKHINENSSAAAAATRAEQTADAVMNSITDVKKALDSLTPSISATQSSIKQISQDLISNANQTSSPQADSPKSYSAIVQQNLQTPGTVSAALARAATRDKQILFDPTPGKVLFAPEITSAEIAAAIKKAITSSEIEDTPDIQIKATTRLRNGGLIIELTTTEAAKWIRTPTNRIRIIEAIGIPATIKERRYSVIVPFLPISANLDEPEWIRTIEEENSMPAGAVESANWIKPRQRRAPTQRVAHAIFHFTDPHSANNVLRDGIYIGQEKLHPRKDKREPVRCVRCQLWGHIAKDCQAPKDTCGTCGKNHRTNECNAYRTFYCVSCDSHEHASWNRNCPEFESKCAGIDAKHPENSMPYFPTDNPWTQVILPPKPTPYRKPTPPPPADPPRPNYRQTNIPFEPRRPSRGMHHMRGAPHHINQRGTRSFTPTGPNSIIITGKGEPNATPTNHATTQPPSTPQHFSNPTSTTPIPSSNGTQRTPTRNNE